MRALAVTAMSTIAMLGLWAGAVHGKGTPPTLPAQALAAAPAPPAPTDKIGYWPNTDLQATWKDLEARQVLNKRVMDGGTFSINIRIVKPGDAPLVHSKSCDVWVVQAGTATAVTGGTLINPQKRAGVDDVAGTEIQGGVEQPLTAGDVLYVPPGVPHGFKDVKGFRGFLIRFDLK